MTKEVDMELQYSCVKDNQWTTGQEKPNTVDG